MQEPKTHSTLIKVIYSLMALWLVGAGIHIGREMLEQHAIFAELKAVRAGGEDHQKAVESLLNRGGKVSLPYVLQEIQQDPGKSTLHRAANALLTAGGAYRAPLGENEKAAVRKLIITAKTALADRIEGRSASFNEDEQRFIQQFIAILDAAELRSSTRPPPSASSGRSRIPPIPARPTRSPTSGQTSTSWRSGSICALPAPRWN